MSSWPRVPSVQPDGLAPSSAVLAAASPEAAGGQHSTSRAGPSAALANASATVEEPQDPAQPTTDTTRSPSHGTHFSGAGFGLMAVSAEAGLRNWPSATAAQARRSSATPTATGRGPEPAAASRAGGGAAGPVMTPARPRSGAGTPAPPAARPR